MGNLEFPATITLKPGASNKQYNNLSHLELRKTLITNSKLVYSICLIKNKRFAASLEDSTIRIFDLKKKEINLTLKGHKDAVFYISRLEEGFLLSSSRDKTIKIWEVKKKAYNCIQTLKGHTEMVMKAIQISSNKIVSCSFDKTLKIWNNLYPYELMHTMKGHINVVTSVIELKNKKALVSCGNELIFWNSEEYNCERIVKEIYCSYNSSLIEVERKIFIGGLNRVSVVDGETYQIICIIGMGKNVQFINSIINFGDGTLLCGEKNGLLVQIELNFDKVIYIENQSHPEKEISCLLLLDNKQFISCSNSVKLWKF